MQKIPCEYNCTGVRISGATVILSICTVHLYSQATHWGIKIKIPCITPSGYARVPLLQNELVMMTSLLLPGTVIIYYGDELGMSDNGNIDCEDTRDPYALPPYAECPDGQAPESSRDTARTPMQVVTSSRETTRLTAIYDIG